MFMLMKASFASAGGWEVVDVDDGGGSGCRWRGKVRVVHLA